MSILHKPICLVLNKFWVPLRPTTPESVFIDMCKDTVRAIAIDYFQNPDGSYNFDTPIGLEAVTWEQWVALPVRDCDFYIQTPRSKIRVPTVAVATSYAKIPTAIPRLNAANVFKRDKGLCQYTGKRLTPKNASMDHVVPRSRGGRTSWDNIVLCDKEVNMAKGNNLNEDVGYKLRTKPGAPRAVPVTARITPDNVGHVDWMHFLLK